MTFDNNIPTKFPSIEPKAPLGPDLLVIERSKASFDISTLTEFMYTKAWLDKRKKILSIIEKDPAFSKSTRYYESRAAKLEAGYKKDKRLIELARKHGWDSKDRQIASFLYDQSTPFSLHHGMFLPTLMNQTTPQQKKLFLDRALKYEIIGCYAQTELGHGSNVQGLETMATYLVDTNEFDMHSPTLTASKWWIGGLGKTANYAIVMARLVIHGQDHGPHPFCVQIRRLDNHHPLPGITIGDIGPKFGYNGVDNGFIMFDHVRIPHISFLAGYAQVMPGTGDYVKPPNVKLSYGTMVYVRADIVMGVRMALAKAATIAIRYSCIRQQFGGTTVTGKANEETPVLDYSLQQYRLLPVVASAYACFFTGREMMRLYNANQVEMTKGNFNLLADLHSSSSGLKSLTTTMAVDAIEDCRRACGGHGYSLFSGFGLFYQDYLPNTTWEGDNYVLAQQTARYLLKTYRQVRTQSLDNLASNPTASYLAEYLKNPNATCPATHPDAFRHPVVLLAAFRFRAAANIAKVAESLDHHGRSWNSMLVDIQRISHMHCQWMLVTNFFDALQHDPLLTSIDYKPIRHVLQCLACLFALHLMEKDLAEFVVCGYLDRQHQAQWVKNQMMALLEQVRPQAVPLVDAFDLPDYYLHSALGRYDGDVYKTLIDMAEKEPLNQSVVVDSYETIIRPLVTSGSKL